MRELVRSYFSAQLDQYLEWINNCGLSPNFLRDAQSEMLDHTALLESEWLTDMYLSIERFKRKMDVSNEDCFDSLPNALTELRKGRRDMLGRVLEAAERLERYSYGEAITVPSAPLGQAIEDFIAELSRQWEPKTTKQLTRKQTRHLRID